MAIKKGAPVQALTPAIDPAVEAALERDPIYGAMGRIISARNMTPGKAKKKASDKRRKKVTFDWPEWLIERLDRMAGVEGETYPLNQLAAVLVIEGLRAAARGELDLEARKIPSRTPVFQYFLRIETEDEL